MFPNNVDGLFYLRKAIGFVGNTNRDDVTELATNYIVKEGFKELVLEDDYTRNGRQYSYVQDGLTTNQIGA